MDKAKLEEEIKVLIIKALDLEDISPADISSEDPLFNEGLGLDSIDGLEIAIALKKKYGIAVDYKQKKYFHSVSSLADWVLSDIKIEKE